MSGLRNVKSNCFDPKTETTRDPDPQNAPNSADRVRMQEVKDQSGSAAWFDATCIRNPPGTDGNQVDKEFEIYFAIDAQRNAIVNVDTLASAPCPPFGNIG